MTKTSRRIVYDISNNYDTICDMLNNKYYNLYRSNFRTKNLTYREEQYVMNRLWENGTVAAFKIKHTDKLGYTKWQRATVDMYGEPESVTLLNKYGTSFIPSTIQVVDKDVVIGYIQSNRKGVKKIVDWYVRRIAQVECIINTQLLLHSIPFLIPVEDGNEYKKLEDIVDRILNHEVVIGIEGVNPNIFKSISTNAPYLIDKLQNYKKDLENELLTYLGVNNNGTNKIEQLQLAEVNSNNEEINLSDDNFNTNLKQFCDRVKEVLGIEISIEICSPDASRDGIEHNYDEKPGPKEDVTNEN